MKAYLTRDGYKGQLEFELPDPRPKPGEVYEWATKWMTAGGHLYEVGDTIELIEMTEESPHGYHCSVGNWRARTRFGVSVWTALEECIQKAQLQKVSTQEWSSHEPLTIWDRLTED